MLDRAQRIRKRDIAKTEPAGPLYVAMDDFDLSFSVFEVNMATNAWDSGVPLPEIADQLCREKEEVFVLLLDLALKNKIYHRAGGLFGEVRAT